MPANQNPIFALTPNTPIAKLVGGTGLARSDGTGTAVGTDMILLFTAGTNGSFVESVQFWPSASAVGTATTATVLRVYLSTKTSGATTGGTDTTLIGELQAASQTAASATVATTILTLQLYKKIAANQTILASSHATNAASTSWSAIAFGGDF